LNIKSQQKRSGAMQVSIKVVVACLLLAASLSTSIIPQIGAVLRLQRDAMSLVVQASSSGIDKVHFVVSQRLRRIESACRVLQKVTEAQGDGRIVTNGDAYDVNKLIEWLGGTVTAMDVGAGFFYDADGAGAYIDPRVKSLATGPKLPGYIHVILNHVDHLDIGQFNLMTQRPANASAPWTRLYEPLWLEYFASFMDEMCENHTSQLRWSRLTPVNSGSKWECSLSFGGVTTLNGAAVVPRRYVYFVLRGSWLSAYFSTVAISKAGAAVLVDTVSGAFVAGNIADPTGRQSSSGRATLMPAADLRDVRIAPVLAAEVLDSITGATSGLEKLMACSTPCSYVYWPHSNTLAGASDGGVFSTSFATLYRDFVMVRVVQVNGDIDDNTDDAPPLMNLRLIVTVPSEDVVGALLGTIRISMWFAVVIAIVVSVIVLVLVSLTIRGVTDAEGELLRMSSVFGISLRVGTVQRGAYVRSQEVTADSLTTRTSQESVFTEVNGILRSIAILSRELRMLRAYAPLPSVIVTASSSQMDEAVTSLSRPVACHSGTVVNDCQPDGCGAPYDASHRFMWKVPVTTVVFRRCLPPPALALTSGPGGIMSEHKRLNVAVSTLVNCMSRIPGCSIDVFGGDSMMVHFNAKARCSKHALVAINTVRRCIAMIANADALINDAPSYSGIVDAVGEAVTTTAPAECGSINGHSATLSSIGGRTQMATTRIMHLEGPIEAARRWYTSGCHRCSHSVG
jgi:hypothetical protein